MDLTIEKGLPLAGGMGGSAASAVAGALAANTLLKARLPPLELLACALEAEEAVSGGRHADNVAPSLLGGAILVAGAHDGGEPQVTVDPGQAGPLAGARHARATRWRRPRRARCCRARFPAPPR